MARRRGRYGGYGGYGGYGRYVPVASRRRQAERFAERMKRQGVELSPVSSRRRDIAATFWGLSWCRNLESYGDYSNRLPRGRRYVRNGSVIDLQVECGRVDAYVSGSEIYTVTVEVAELDSRRWEALREACAGSVASLVDLLEGRLSEAVMARITARDDGVFPSPAEIEIECSCPDHAVVCKHVAATLYGIGVRFDEEPTLFFKLRGVDAADLLDAATATGLGTAADAAAGTSEIADDDLGAVFGIDLDDEPAAPSSAATPSSPASSNPASSLGASPPGRVARHPDDAESTDDPVGDETLTARELVAAGIPRSTISSWLRRGALAPTSTRGVYRMTDETGPAMERFFDRLARD